MKKSKLITMAISLLAAICLWIYVVTVVNPEGTTTISNIPVTFSGAEVLREDQGLVLSGDYQDMVTVSFTGKNSDMKKLEQNKDEISAVVDVSKIRSTRDYTLSYDLLLPDAVPDSAVTITDRTPGNITVHVEKLVKKPVPVKGDFSQVEVAEGYMLDSTTFDYDTVTVEGAESVVNQIEYALISMNRTNVDKTISEQLDYTLVDANGDPVDTSELTMDVQAIDVTLTVVMYKEVQLDVKFIDGGGATSSDVSYTIDPETITLSGDATALEGVNTILLDNIDLSAIMKNEDTVLRQSPSANVTVPSAVTVEIWVCRTDLGPYCSDIVFNIDVTDTEKPVIVTAKIAEGVEMVLYETTLPVGLQQPVSFTAYLRTGGEYECTVYVGGEEYRRTTARFALR